MIEYVFRMTHDQFTTVAGLLADHGGDALVSAICGAGSATWPSSTERLSWSFRAVENTLSGDNMIQQLMELPNGRRCIFSTNKDALEHWASYVPTALWAHVDGNTLLVYRFHAGILIPVDVCSIVGHDLYFRFNGEDPMTATDNISEELFERTLQAFGRGTTHYLSNLTVGVAGVSGTGSIVAEQLMRLGVKRLVLVDDDAVEVRNLGRILNSTTKDAKEQVNKALMMKRAYDNINMGTEVISAPTVISVPQTVHWLSQCDLLFGCLDSTDGRMHLNRISTFYSIPYIDLGVKLASDHGQITEISGAIRYVRPDGASLLSMKAYSPERLASDSLRRNDPAAYHARLAEKYIIGATESSPAVISVNMLVAALAVQELLNRLHPFRNAPNSEIEVIHVDMCELAILAPSKPAPPDTALGKHLGCGDCTPLIGLPMLGA